MMNGTHPSSISNNIQNILYCTGSALLTPAIYGFSWGYMISKAALDYALLPRNSSELNTTQRFEQIKQRKKNSDLPILQQRVIERTAASVALAPATLFGLLGAKVAYDIKGTLFTIGIVTAALNLTQKAAVTELHSKLSVTFDEKTIPTAPIKLFQYTIAQVKASLNIGQPALEQTG